MSRRNYTRPYVGVVGAAGPREVFRSAVTPTDGIKSAMRGSKYMYVIGPFRTMRGARYMATYGRGTDWTVAQAERYARST